MKQKSIKTSLDLVTEEEKRDMHDELLRRNRMRKEAKLLLLDIDAELAKEIARVGQDKFNVELKPYLSDAYDRIPPSRGGFIAAMRREGAVRNLAEERLRDKKGLVRSPRRKD